VGQRSLRRSGLYVTRLAGTAARRSEGAPWFRLAEAGALGALDRYGLTRPIPLGMIEPSVVQREA
ncbi:MAG TPA: hypothetical protein VNM50_03185, partial [Chloroflexota bacterium]|nr:hypothetical protein [Chloroflexota bacterium]